MTKIWEALYNSSCCESSYQTLSIHKTRQGAVDAINKHQDKLREQREMEDKKEWLMHPEDEEEIKEHSKNYPWNFDMDWEVRETFLYE